MLQNKIGEQSEPEIFEKLPPNCFIFYHSEKWRGQALQPPPPAMYNTVFNICLMFSS